MQWLWQIKLAGWLLRIVVTTGVFVAYFLLVSIGTGETGKLNLPLRATLITKPYEFPQGGRTLFPNYRLVALYGSPDMPALGSLGEQPLDATITRAQQLAASYQPYSHERILPTLEIIATVASSTPTDNGDYSDERIAQDLQPWVDAALAHGVYVILDLQPGRNNFLSQAQEFAPLLKQPNVGLALDPEWRLSPSQVPLVQIGSVDVNEINQTTQWLAQLTSQNHLPQKVVVLHEFRTDMIVNREQLDTNHPELAFVIQMDGNGAQNVKLDTWHTITATAPPKVNFGWKNFYHQDPSVLSPEDTMQITPQPWFVSYQ